MDNKMSKAVVEAIKNRQLKDPGERYTKFLNMYLPGTNNFYDVNKDQNQNFEKIDGALETAQRMATDLFSKKQDKTDNSLKTADKTVTGAINELNIRRVDTIADLKASDVKVGDVLEILGYYEKSDGATHKRVIASEDDGSGVELDSGLWANLVKAPLYIFSSFNDLKKSAVFPKSKAIVKGLYFDVETKIDSEVGFEDELHIKTEHGFYANFNIEESTFDYIIKKQNESIGQYLRLNATSKEVNIVLQGDSITYGTDLKSDDRIPAPSEELPDGSHHTTTRSPYPINVKLQEYLRKVTLRSNINVINRGYAGDWAQKSYTRWRTSVGSNLTVFLLGQNDFWGEWIPDKYHTPKEFIRWNLMLGIREVLRGAVVVFTNGFKAKNINSGANRQNFLELNKPISEIIGALFLDTTDILLGADETFYSDGIHLNSKGYSRVASRLCGFFLGENLIKPVIVSNSGSLGVSYDYYNAYSDQPYATTGNSNGIEGEVRALYPGKSLFIPFYLDDLQTQIQLLTGTESFKAKIEIDFGTEQYIQKSDFIIERVREKPVSELETFTTNTILFKIFGRGFHVLKITNAGDSVGYFGGVVLKEIETDYREIFIDTITPKSLNDKFTETYMVQFLLYNNSRIKGYLNTPDGQYYYETFKQNKLGFNGNREKREKFVIKVYAVEETFVEKCYVFRSINQHTLEFLYESTCFNKI